MISVPPQRPGVPNLGFGLALFSPATTETVPWAGGWVTVTVTPRGWQALFQKVGEESRRSAPESTVSQIGSGTEWSAKATSATSRGPVAPPSNNAAKMIARIIIDPSVTPKAASQLVGDDLQAVQCDVYSPRPALEQRHASKQTNCKRAMSAVGANAISARRSMDLLQQLHRSRIAPSDERTGPYCRCTFIADVPSTADQDDAAVRIGRRPGMR
jgi:hypothetical protein